MSIKSIAGMGIAAAGTVYAMGKLSGMDSDEIRQKGEAALDTLHSVGDKVASSDIAQDIVKKMEEYPFTKSIANVLGKGISGVSNGFGKFIDVLADAKEKTELDGSDFSKNLAGGIGEGLKGAVASAKDYIAEKLGMDETRAGNTSPAPEVAVENDGPSVSL